LIEALPKIADVKILKELSKVIIIPMLIAAFIIQTGVSIGFGPIQLTISPESPLPTQALVFLLIFVLKGSFVTLMAGFLNWLLLCAHLFSNLTALRMFAVLFLAFGFLGVFAGEDLVFLNTLNKMWFYTAFVMGFYCLASATDIEAF
jgi:hypothetical protein